MLTAILEGTNRAFTAEEAKTLGNDAGWVSVVTGDPVKLRVLTPEVHKIEPMVQFPEDRFLQRNGAYFAYSNKTSHPPTRSNNPLRTNAFRVIYGLLKKKNMQYDLLTDQLTGGFGDFAASDITICDAVEGKRTELFIETDTFNFTDLETTVESLSSNGIHSMIVLSAYDRLINKHGAYLRPVREIEIGKEEKSQRHKSLYKLKGNEEKLIEWFKNAMTYCRHSNNLQNNNLVQAFFPRVFLPIILSEPTDSDLKRIVMREHGELFYGNEPTIVTVEQPYNENKHVKGIWTSVSGVRIVNVEVGNGMIKRELTSYRKKPSLDIINELVIMYGTTERDGFLVAFPTPLRHLEARREAEKPVQIGIF